MEQPVPIGPIVILTYQNPTARQRHKTIYKNIILFCEEKVVYWGLDARKSPGIGRKISSTTKKKSLIDAHLAIYSFNGTDTKGKREVFLAEKICPKQTVDSVFHL